ncbi:MAG: hypothetical protein LBP53_04755 [Candidatus Peribacteria bacterium]|nr:hypothetical protein [Candidatus Peribacteria bacterium]
MKADNVYKDYSTNYNGEVRHQLSTNEMPSHSHTINSFTDWENGDDSSSSAQEVKEAGLKNTSSVGGNQPHNNMPPFYVVYYYMKVKSNFASTPTGICSGQTYTKYNALSISVPQLVDSQIHMYSDYNATKRYTIDVTIKCNNGTLTHSVGYPKCNNSDYNYNAELGTCGAKCNSSYSYSYKYSDNSC